MKKLFFMYLVSFCFLISNSQAFAEKYLGKFCWQVFDEEKMPYWSFKFGVYEKEGNNFMLVGSVDYDANGVSAAHGNAISTNDGYKMTITAGDNEEGSEVWSKTFLAKLDKSTFNGTWDALFIEKVAGDSTVFLTHHSGSMDLVACN